MYYAYLQTYRRAYAYTYIIHRYTQALSLILIRDMYYSNKIRRTSTASLPPE